MKDVFELKEPPYNLRSESNHFTRRNVKTTYYGLSSIKHLAPQIWELVPQSLKKCKTLNESKLRSNPGIQIIDLKLFNTTPFCYCFEKRYYFGQKNADFLHKLQKILVSSF